MIPKFNTSRELHVAHLIPEPKDAPIVVKIVNDKPLQSNHLAPQQERIAITKDSLDVVKLARKTRRRSFIRRASIFLILITTFAFALFTTQNYLRNGRIFPKTLNPFASTLGIAVSDVNLRVSNDVDSQRLGLVPKGSRVKIVSSKDNWLEIDIIEISRPKENPTDADHGWVHRKYIDIQE